MSRSCVTADSILAGAVIDLAGVPTRIWAADRDRAEALAFNVRAASTATGPPGLEIRVEAGTAASTPWSGDEPIAVRREGSGVVEVRSRVGLVARVTADRIVISGDAPDLRAALRPVFAFALAHAFSDRGRPVLHAATLGVGDGCVLVLGTTGTGKSTVALCALRCGWPVLGDDLVVLDPRPGEVLATAVPRPIAAPRDLVDDSRAVAIAGDARERVELPADVITLGTRPVVGVVLTTHGSSPTSSLQPVRPFAVPPVVLASCLVADDTDARRELFPLAVSLSRLPTVELAHGSRPETRLAGGAALLDQLRTRDLTAG
jgi:hypothetical protein